MIKNRFNKIEYNLAWLFLALSFSCDPSFEEIETFIELINSFWEEKWYLKLSFDEKIFAFYVSKCKYTSPELINKILEISDIISNDINISKYIIASVELSNINTFVIQQLEWWYNFDIFK